MENSGRKALKGGEFLIRDIDAAEIFIPEEWNEEQQMIISSTRDFLDAEVFPHLDRIDALEPGLMPALLTKAGNLGLLGVSVPEAYGGFGKNFNTSMLVSEVTGSGFSFAVALSAHTGIGTLPILYYGTDDQKNKYIPKLASGEWKAAYCLTEPGSGSDANSAKTRAVLSADGKHYILNGQKMWITNGGFADVYTVFAKIDNDENLSAFIVERNYPGLSLNEEEKKMGIKGSSTVQVFFNDCQVPVENLLSERQNGFKIAVNILNIGRIKLAAAAIGGCKQSIGTAVKYANEREQFGRPISKYGAIRHKLAEMVIRTYASESAAYRIGQNIDDAFDQLVAEGIESGKARLKSVEQFAVECAMMKVHASEALDFVVDEGVQIFGGMGYSAEAPMDRAYRDARINRIFEGTNEINRMLAVDMMLKRAMKGDLDLMGPAMDVAAELMAVPDFSAPEDAPFAAEKILLKGFKKAVLMVAGAAVQKLMMTLAKEQEILMHIADMLIETYVSESLLLRIEKLHRTRGGQESAVYLDMLQVYMYDAADRVHVSGKNALNGFSDGDELRMMMMGLRRFTKTQPFNAKEARRRIAQHLIDQNRYCF